MLDARSGSIQHKLPLSGIGDSFVTMALLGSEHRLIIADYYGMIQPADPWGWVLRWLRRWTPFLPAPEAGTRIDPGSIMMLDTSRL